MRLREAKKYDISGMRRVRYAVLENALSDPNLIPESDYIDALEDLGRSWVIESDGEIVGFASGYSNGNIWALFVHPNHEGFGYGKALHTAMIDWLWSLGHARLWLTTNPSTRAEGFYISLGWQSCGTVSSGEVRLELFNPNHAVKVTSA